MAKIVKHYVDEITSYFICLSLFISSTRRKLAVGTNKLKRLFEIHRILLEFYVHYFSNFMGDEISFFLAIGGIFKNPGDIQYNLFILKNI